MSQTFSAPNEQSFAPLAMSCSGTGGLSSSGSNEVEPVGLLEIEELFVSGDDGSDFVQYTLQPLAESRESSFWGYSQVLGNMPWPAPVSSPAAFNLSSCNLNSATSGALNDNRDHKFSRANGSLDILTSSSTGGSGTKMEQTFSASSTSVSHESNAIPAACQEPRMEFSCLSENKELAITKNSKQARPPFRIGFLTAPVNVDLLADRAKAITWDRESHCVCPGYKSIKVIKLAAAMKTKTKKQGTFCHFECDELRQVLKLLIGSVAKS